MLQLSFAPARADLWGLYDLSVQRCLDRALTIVRPSLAARRQQTVVVGVGSPGQPLVLLAAGDLSADPACGRLVARANREQLSRIRPLGLVATRNPVFYIEDVACACGCGEIVGRESVWRVGHEQRALYERVNRYFNGDVATAIREIDRVFGLRRG